MELSIFETRQLIRNFLIKGSPGNKKFNKNFLKTHFFFKLPFNFILLKLH